MHTDYTVSAHDILIFEKVFGGVRRMYGHFENRDPRSAR